MDAVCASGSRIQPVSKPPAALARVEAGPPAWRVPLALRPGPRARPERLAALPAQSAGELSARRAARFAAAAALPPAPAAVGAIRLFGESAIGPGLSRRERRSYSRKCSAPWEYSVLAECWGPSAAPLPARPVATLFRSPPQLALPPEFAPRAARAPKFPPEASRESAHESVRQGPTQWNWNASSCRPPQSREEHQESHPLLPLIREPAR